MRAWTAAWGVIAVLCCGCACVGCGSGTEPTPEDELVEDERTVAPSSEQAPTETPTSDPPATPATTSTPTVPSCDRLAPCIEAFVAVAPDTLAGPARIARAQLDTALPEGTSREPSCAAAIASYRHDLETLDLEVPEACR